MMQDLIGQLTVNERFSHVLFFDLASFGDGQIITNNEQGSVFLFLAV
jgi:hypothetical protein